MIEVQQPTHKTNRSYSEYIDYIKEHLQNHDTLYRYMPRNEELERKENLH